MENNTIFTIGHSTHTLDFFLELLQTQSINCVIDVRSVAASGFNPHFNKVPLANFLKKNEVIYLHFAKEFGARHHNPALLDEEKKVDFTKVQQSEIFNLGVEILKSGLAKGYKIALMCSEAEPFDCHRFSMVSIYLEAIGFEIQHILKDKSIKTNTQLENQLLKKYAKKLPKPNIFEPNVNAEMQLKAAYRMRNKEIAYSPFDKEQPIEML
jgi:uncharacterized protein (DUF488 family)